MYTEAQQKGRRQAELESSLKGLHAECAEIEEVKRRLVKQVGPGLSSVFLAFSLRR